MADVMLKDSSGADRTYPGIDTVSLPTADGGVATFTLGGSGGLGVQADLQQTDSTASDYVKGQYFGYLPDNVPETTVEFTEDSTFNGTCYATTDFAYNIPLVIGTTYKVTWNDVEYTLVAKDPYNVYDSAVSVNGVFLGNFNIGFPINNNEEASVPFLFLYNSNDDVYVMYALASEPSTNTFKIALSNNKKLLSPTWLPDNVVLEGELVRAIPKPDLQQTDVNSKDYVKGQYFGLMADIIPETYVKFQYNGTVSAPTTSYNYTTPIVAGSMYKVKWGSEEYTLTAKLFNDEGLDEIFQNSVVLGNTNIIATNKVDGLEEESVPFLFISLATGGTGFLSNDTTAISARMVKITAVDNKLKLGTEWLSEEVATKTFVEEAIANIEIPEGSGGSSNEVDIVSLTELSFSDSAIGAYTSPISLSATSFIIGASYNVMFDSVTYRNLTAKYYKLDTTIAYVYIGNASMLDASFEDTHENFICAIALNNGVLIESAIATSETDATHEVRIYQEKESGTVIEKDIFVSQTISGFTFNDTYQAYSDSGSCPAPFTLVEGESYYVEWDGLKHLCVAKIFNDGTSDIIFIGNGSKVGLSDNGEDFMICYDSAFYGGVGAIQFFSLTSTESHTVRIYQTEVVLNKPDWNENNPDSPNYIANRPFYEVSGELKTIMPETQIIFSEDGQYGTEPTPEIIALWESDWSEAIVMWDGDEYVCKPRDYFGLSAIGNVDLANGTGDTGEPFAFAIDSQGSMSGSGNPLAMLISVLDVGESHTVSIKVATSSIKTLDSKFISEVPWSKVTDAPFGDVSPAGAVIYDGIIDLGTSTESSIYEKLNIVKGGKYLVCIDDTCFECEAFEEYSEELGIVPMLEYRTPSDGLVFRLGVWNRFGVTVVKYHKSGTHSLKITTASDIINKIDSKYLDIIESGVDESTIEVVAPLISFNTEPIKVADSDEYYWRADLGQISDSIFVALHNPDNHILVSWDDNSYEINEQFYGETEGMFTALFGNTALNRAVDVDNLPATDEPFLITIWGDVNLENVLMDVYTDETSDDVTATFGHTMEISVGKARQRIKESYAPTTPRFNLSKMGLPEIPITGESVTVETDTSALIEAANRGAVNFTVVANAMGFSTEVSSNVNPVKAGMLYQANIIVVFNAIPMVCSIEFDDAGIYARAITLMPAQS